MDISIAKPAMKLQTASEEAQNYANLQGLDKLKQEARQDQRAALQPVAEQFEALFVEQVFKESRKVSLDDGWLDGNQGDFYKDWHDKQLAQDLAAKGTLGFADNIVEQLAGQVNAVPDKNITTREYDTTQDALTIRNLR